MRQVIAIGGGGFGRTQESHLIEQYILDQSIREKPNICFIPTATGDLDPYVVNFYTVFSKLNCNPSHISFFKRTIDLEEHILNQDVIFVGGGNTKSMLAVWKDWGLDLILKKAYDQKDYRQAKSELWGLMEELKKINLCAARSLKEGMEETLTLHELDVCLSLRQSLSTTNMLESGFSCVRRRTDRVYSWRFHRSQSVGWRSDHAAWRGGHCHHAAQSSFTDAQAVGRGG